MSLCLNKHLSMKLYTAMQIYVAISFLASPTDRSGRLFQTPAGLPPRERTGCLCDRIQGRIHSSCGLSMDRTNRSYSLYSSNILDAVNCLRIHLTLQPRGVGIAANLLISYSGCSRFKCQLLQRVFSLRLFYFLQFLPLTG